MNTREYLSRIGIDQTEIRPDATALKFLQKQHLLNVPFENLDIHWKRPIVLDTDSFYRKIVGENRGGFCYELNGLFNALLGELGFETKIISARVVGYEEGVFSPEYDHLAIIAKVDGEEYLVDVGFGGFIAEPLKMDLDVEQQDSTGVFRIREYAYDDRDYLIVERKTPDGPNEWKSEDIFTVRARDLAEFTDMCNFHQTSPDSHFMKNKICSTLTETGRKTLTGDKFIVTENGERTETPVETDEVFSQILKQEFGIKRHDEVKM